MPDRQAEAAGADPAPVVALTDEEFRVKLAEVLPQLRAFSRSLATGQPDFADDLVQDALLRAWSARGSFRAGTNFRAWIFVILRNLFLSEMRRSKFKGEWNEIAAEKLLVSPMHQERHIELGDMQRALSMLPVGQREALILVGAGGFSYKDAADITGVAVGTVKSRVARARMAVEAIMAGDSPLADAERPTGESQPFEDIMDRLDIIADGQGESHGNGRD